MREICVNLVNIHGQHDNQALLDPARHINILDNFAELEGAIEQYCSVYSELVKVKRERDSIKTDNDEKERRLELLRYQADEIEKAALLPGEEEELNELKRRLQTPQSFFDSVNVRYRCLNGADEAAGSNA